MMSIGPQYHVIWHRWTVKGYVKTQVFNPLSIFELNNEIICVVGETEPQLFQNVFQNFNKRVDIYRAAIGGYWVNIIFLIKWITTTSIAETRFQNKCKLCVLFFIEKSLLLHTAAKIYFW